MSEKHGYPKGNDYYGIKRILSFVQDLLNFIINHTASIASIKLARYSTTGIFVYPFLYKY